MSATKEWLAEKGFERQVYTNTFPDLVRYELPNAEWGLRPCKDGYFVVAGYMHTILCKVTTAKEIRALCRCLKSPIT